MNLKKYFAKIMLELYKDLIIDHGLNPRNKYIMKNFTHFSRGFNHFCGDTVVIYINIINNTIKELSFDGSGCSISTASASLMTLILKDKCLDEAYTIFYYFQNLIKNKTDINNIYKDINILASVNKFPSRVKCATLVWHTFKDAVDIKILEV
ncbi:MAG TPA: SUF system NifU family Fe-S cluster assembly protein [Candidatus Azoamicus sp. OHIO2]